jgi:hypothetical protein
MGLTGLIRAHVWSAAEVPVFQEPEKQNCLALLGFASLLWCTEALPLYVTSMLVPLLAVVLRVMVDKTVDPPVRKSAPDAADAIFKAMFSQVRALLPCRRGDHLVVPASGSGGMCHGRQRCARSGSTTPLKTERVSRSGVAVISDSAQQAKSGKRACLSSPFGRPADHDAAAL